MLSSDITTAQHSLKWRWQLEQQTISVEEAAKILGIGRNSAYNAAKAGEIPAIRIGGRWRVSKPALDKMLEEGKLNTAAA